MVRRQANRGSAPWQREPRRQVSYPSADWRLARIPSIAPSGSRCHSSGGLASGQRPVPLPRQPLAGSAATTADAIARKATVAICRIDCPTRILTCRASRTTPARGADVLAVPRLADAVPLVRVDDQSRRHAAGLSAWWNARPIGSGQRRSSRPCRISVGVFTLSTYVSGLCFRIASGTSHGRPPNSHSVQLCRSLRPHIMVRSVTAFCATAARNRVRLADEPRRHVAAVADAVDEHAGPCRRRRSAIELVHAGRGCRACPRRRSRRGRRR